MAAKPKVIASIELSSALGFKAGVPVTPAEIKRRVLVHTRPADPMYARIKSKGSALFYEVAALRQGRIASRYDGNGNSYGRGDCQKCGAGLERGMRITGDQSPDHWVQHLPDALACNDCGEKYAITYVNPKGYRDATVAITAAERKALR